MKEEGAKSKSDLECVVQYVFEKNIALNSDQEVLLQRLQFTDDKLRSRKFTREQVINAICTRFGVSSWRADKDITETHKLFGSTRRLNKGYLIAIHLDDIQQQIALAKEARRLDLLPKLNDNFIYALNSIPEDAKENDRPPVKLVFVQSAQPTLSKKIEDLLAEANHLSINATAYESIEFEDEPGGQDNTN
jgi:hypothetical protein